MGMMGLRNQGSNCTDASGVIKGGIYERALISYQIGKGSMFLRNVDKFLPDCTASHSGRSIIRSQGSDNLKFHNYFFIGRLPGKNHVLQPEGEDGATSV
jgi:hypothetical protein